MEQTCENCKHSNVESYTLPCSVCIGYADNYSEWEANTVKKCKDCKHCKHYRLIGGYLKGSACLSCLSMDNWEAKVEKQCSTCRYKEKVGNSEPCSDCTNVSEWEPKPLNSSFTSEIQEAILSGKEVWFFNDDENEWTKFKTVSEEDPNPSDAPSIYAALYCKWSLTKPKGIKTAEVYVSDYLLGIIKNAPDKGWQHISNQKTNTESNLIKVSYEE